MNVIIFFYFFFLCFIIFMYKKMESFNDFYNRFILNTYGVNILNYVFFLSFFFFVILFGIIFILLITNRGNRFNFLSNKNKKP